MLLKKRTFNPWVSVIAVAFGYFVDLYDLLLFSSVRVASLKELGYTGTEATHYTTNLMNITVWGILIGGIAWGLLADKKGRITVLFASILTYTVANFVNAYVHDVTTYQVCRFFAGFGLAGELGVGITLISEILPKNKRTTATMLISSAGMLGAVGAGILTNALKGQIVWGLSSWRFLFMLGGFLGLAVLLFRVSVLESSLFDSIKSKTSYRKIVSLLFSDRKRFMRFAFCFLAGLPVFFIIGNFITLSPEYGKLSGLTNIQPSTAVIWCYLSIAVFDIFGTLLSKVLHSRKKVLYSFLVIQTIVILLYLFVPVQSDTEFYFRCALLGMGIGHWGVIVVNSAEQFGTNLRATVTTSVPSIIRWLLIPLTLFFNILNSYFDIVISAAVVSAFALIVGFIAVSGMKDKFENDADYIEN